MNCQNPKCQKPLTGRRRKWCSVTCQVAVWDAAHPDKASERFRRYQKSDKGKSVQNNREHSKHRKDYKSDYAKTEVGREIVRNKLARRVNRLRGLDATFTAADWKDVLAYFDHKCAYCGKSDKLHQEHFVPAAKGGGYTRNNIIPACPKCNHGKRDLNPIEWIAALPNALVAYARIVAYLKIFN